MNTKTGFWSAFGAIAGGVLGAYAAKHAAKKHYIDQRPGNAMAVGAAAGSVLGAFLGGANADTERVHNLEAFGGQRLAQLVERARS